MNMIIGVSGATGFIGRAFCAHARAHGHRVVAYSRHASLSSHFDEVRRLTLESAGDFTGLHAFVHLAGEPVLGLWTKKKRDSIRRSRVDLTCAIVRRMRETPEPPKIFVSASGVAIYGDRGDDVLTESAAPGTGFLAEVSQAWEAAAAEAASYARVVSLRIPPVLGNDGGPLPVQRRLFRLGLGGKLGGGRQWMPWIHLDDIVRLLLHAVDQPDLSGPVNATSPDPVRNSEFTTALAKSLHRPAILPAPAFALRMLPGGMASMFLDSARVIPEAASRSGFRWLHSSLDSALADLLGT